MTYQGQTASGPAKDYASWTLFNSDQAVIDNVANAVQEQVYTPSSNSGSVTGGPNAAPGGDLFGNDCNFAILTFSPTEAYTTMTITVNTAPYAFDLMAFIGGE